MAHDFILMMNSISLGECSNTHEHTNAPNDKHQGHAVFCVEDFLVYEVKEYESIGAGMYYGLTALYLGHTPREAVKVSCDLCCYVAEPIIEIEFPREEE